MGKLLQILNEYRLGRGMSEYTKYIPANWCFTHKSHYYDHYSWVISKKFWFIQWLVGMAKIDYEAWHNVFVNSNYFDNIAGLREYEVLTMYLSIQDEPIEFLISILK